MCPRNPLRYTTNLAVRIPLAIAKQASLGEGDSVKIVLDRGGAIVLRPACRKYELADLLGGSTPKTCDRETD